MRSVPPPYSEVDILHIITRLDPGGSSENTLLTCKGLHQAGYHVLLATALKGNPTQPFRLVDLSHLQQSINPVNDFIAFFQILSLIRKEKPRIVHTHSSKAGFLGRWSAWIYKKCLMKRSEPPLTIIHTPHGHVFYGYFGPIKSRFYIWLERMTASITDILIALSEGEKRESLEHGVGRETQWRVIHSGVNIESLSEISSRKSSDHFKTSLHIPSGKLVIGIIARQVPIKGIPILIEAAQILKERKKEGNLHFLVVGGGKLINTHQKKVRKANLHTQFTFTGHRTDATELLAAMDIYVQPSLNEGMGKTLVQAHGVGLPIIASHVCGIPDVVKDQETGILIPPHDPKAFADAIDLLSLNQERRRQFGEKGRQWILGKDETGHSRFSVESMVKKIIDLCRPLLT